MLTLGIFRRALAVMVGTALVSITPLAVAQDFPVKGRPISIIVGFPPGGGADATLRIVAQKLGDVLGTSVIVENKPGASTMMAANEVAHDAPDGYTLLYAPSSTMTQNPLTLLHVAYDPFKDFTFISMAARGPLVLEVSTTVPANNVRELVAYAKARPGTISFASFGTGTSSHIFGEMFDKKTGIDATHVPYKGASAAAPDLIAGRVQYMFDSVSSAIITAGTGKVKIIAVAAAARIAALPNVPTLDEQGVTGFDLPSWLGFYGPANMPSLVVKRLNAALTQVLAMSQVQEFYRTVGYEAGATTPEEFERINHSTYDRWSAVIQEIGFKKR